MPGASSDVSTSRHRDEAGPVADEGSESSARVPITATVGGSFGPVTISQPLSSRADNFHPAARVPAGQRGVGVLGRSPLIYLSWGKYVSPLWEVIRANRSAPPWGNTPLPHDRYGETSLFPMSLINTRDCVPGSSVDLVVREYDCRGAPPHLRHGHPCRGAWAKYRGADSHGCENGQAKPAAGVHDFAWCRFALDRWRLRI